MYVVPSQLIAMSDPNQQYLFQHVHEAEVQENSGVEEPTVPSQPSPECLPRDSSVRDDEPVYDANIKVLSSTNKKEFTVYRLRNISVNHFSSPNSLKEDQLGTAVSRKLDFNIGYFHRNMKHWINNKQDLNDACKLLISSKRLTMWCIGSAPEKSMLRKRSGSEACAVDSTSDDEEESTRRRRLSDEEEDPYGIAYKKKKQEVQKNARVKKMKAKLQQIHGADYSALQYTLWAEMIVGETHESFDSPPQVPMFGMKRVRGRQSLDLNSTLMGVADKIVGALSPSSERTPTIPTSTSSPSKSIEF